MVGFEVEAGDSGERLDRLSARRLEITRSAAQRLISSGDMLVDGESSSASRKLRAGEHVEANIPSEGPEAEEIPLSIVYEDDYLLVVDKPASLVTHPGAGNRTGTLVNGLLPRGIAGGDDPSRPGIVHRLDRDTSGLLVVAKGEPAYSTLVGALSRHEVMRVYRAVALGTELPASGTIDSPVGRDPENPTLMAAGVGKRAVTHFERLEENEWHTMLRVKLETGRTHQIRVHLSAIDHPIYADPLYGEAVEEARLWLHAERLALDHPVSGERLELAAPVPEDLVVSAGRLGLHPHGAA